MRPFDPLTRRALVAGTGTIATMALLGAPAGGQIDGFRTIRARETGYDGAAPGPVLRVNRGEELKVRLVNESADETAIHWHGGGRATRTAGARADTHAAPHHC